MTGVAAKTATTGESPGRLAGILDTLTGLAGMLATWLLAAIFLTLPLNTLRPFKEIALADVLIAFLLPIAFFLFVMRFLVKRRLGNLPKWLWAGAVLLLISMALVELVPVIDPDRLVASFDTYKIEGGSSLVVGLRVIFALVAFPVIIGIVTDRWSVVRLLINCWIIGVSISCGVALIDVVLGTGIQQAFAYQPDLIRGYLVVFPGEAARQVGLTDHPNTLSLTAVMVSPLIMARMKSRQGLIRYGPIMALVTFGILVSGARVGVAGLILAVGFTLFMDARFRVAARTLKTRTIVLIIAALAVMATLLAVAVFASPKSDIGKLAPSSLSRLRPSENTTTISDNERGNRLDDSIGFIKERPVLGYGFQWVEASHNTVLQLLMAGGILALAGFFLVLIGYLKIGFGLRRHLPDTERDVAIAVTVSMLIYVISGLVINHVFERYLYIPAGLILAIDLIRKAPDYSASRDA